MGTLGFEVCIDMCVLNVCCPGRGKVGVKIKSTSLDQVLRDSLTVF